MSTFDVCIAEEEVLQSWDQWIDESEGGYLYHKLAWLQAIAQETNTEFTPLICRKEQKVVALFPIFVKKGTLAVVLSPPPLCSVPELGPVLLFNAERQFDFEKDYFSIVKYFASFIEKEFHPDLIRIKSTIFLQDIRPYVWGGYSIVPRYTYRIPLEAGTDELFARFKKQVRTDIRRAAKYDDLELIEGDQSTYRAVCTMVRARYNEQEISWNSSDTYLDSLYNSFGGKHLRTKAIVHQGEVITGLVVIDYKKRVHHWLGGVKPEGSYIGLNELLHWEIIKEAAKKGYTYYELVGGNTKHLCRHKSKYNPYLAIYFDMEVGTFKGRTMRYLLDTHVGKFIMRKLKGRK